MSGDGSGYLYYEVERSYYEGEDIIIGNGLGKLSKKINNQKNDEQSLKESRIKLEEIILKKTM